MVFSAFSIRGWLNNPPVFLTGKQIVHQRLVAVRLFCATAAAYSEDTYCRGKVGGDVLPGIGSRPSRPLGYAAPRKAAFELRLALASQLRAKALRKDLLKPLGAPAVLFRSDEYATGSPDHGWSKLCNQLAVVPIRGGHISMNSEQLCANLVQAVEISSREVHKS